MKVSIITVSYNAVKTIEDTIKSVLSQDFNDIEYIVIDGNSSDGTQDVISKYIKNIDHFISEPDKGIYYGMNKGVALATGDVVGILNADDIYTDNNVVSSIVNVFDLKNTDSVYADLEYVDEIDLNLIKRKWKSGEYKKDNFLEGWMPPHPTFFIKRKHYLNYGFFNTSLRSAADYELMLRMLFKNKLTAEYLPKSIIKMRVGGMSNSSISHRIKANKEDRLAWKLNNLTPKWYTLYKKPISKLTQFFSFKFGNK